MPNFDPNKNVDANNMTTSDMMNFLATMKSSNLINDEDIMVVGNSIGELVAAGADESANTKALYKLCEHFFDPANVVKRLDGLASNYSVLKLAMPVVKKIILGEQHATS